MNTYASRAFARPISAAAVAIALFTLGNALLAGCGSKSEQTSEGTSASQTQTQTPAASSAPVASDVDEGAKIYAEKCSVCHGANGKGDGPGGAALNPKPRDHTDGKYMNTRTDDELLAVLHNGKGAMPAWKGVLTDDQMKAVLKHVRSLAVPPYTPTASK
jgi:mono/diheme cytochrome c family protein